MLKYPFVDEMLRKMNSRELSEWMAFFSLENQEWEEKKLKIEAEAGVKQMRAKRKK